MRLLAAVALAEGMPVESGLNRAGGRNSTVGGHEYTDLGISSAGSVSSCMSSTVALAGLGVTQVSALVVLSLTALSGG